MTESSDWAPTYYKVERSNHTGPSFAFKSCNALHCLQQLPRLHTPHLAPPPLPHPRPPPLFPLPTAPPLLSHRPSSLFPHTCARSPFCTSLRFPPIACTLVVILHTALSLPFTHLTPCGWSPSLPFVSLLPTHVWEAYSVRGFSKHRIHSVSLTTSPIPPPSHTPTPTAVVSPPLPTRFTLSHTLPYLATCSVEDQAWLRATSLCTISLKLALLTQSPDLTQGRYMALLEGLTPPVPPHFPICIHIPPFLFPLLRLRQASPLPSPARTCASHWTCPQHALCFAHTTLPFLPQSHCLPSPPFTPSLFPNTCVLSPLYM